MKKVLFFALAATLTACNSNTTSTAPEEVINQDSVSVVDSSVTANDTTTAAIGKE